MAKQLLLVTAPDGEQADQAVVDTNPIQQVICKSLRTPKTPTAASVPPTAAATSTIAQEVQEKTDTIMELAKKHPDIVVKSIHLPSGYIINYNLKGGSMFTKHHAENEFVQKIMKAIPKTIRGKHDYFRGTVSRKLDGLTVWVGNNQRFCPIKHIHEVFELFENAKKNGVGKKEISIKGIIDEFMAHMDEINARAEEYGIAERIVSRELLEKKIRFLPHIFDISFTSSAMGINSEELAEYKSNMEKDFKVEIESDLKNRMKKVFEKLSASLKVIRKSKKGKAMNKRTHDALMRNMDEIEKLNITESEELKNMVRLSKALATALSTQDIRAAAKTIDNTSAKTPEEMFAEAFRKSSPEKSVTASDEDIGLNSIIEEIASQL